MVRLVMVVIGLALGGCSAPQRTGQPAEARSGGQAEAMVLEVQSDKSVEQLRRDLPKAAAAQKFGVLAVHDLSAKMREKGVDFGGEVLVFEVCNPHKAKVVLEKAPAASSLLPCRISVYTAANGKTTLSTIRPTRLIGAVGVSGLESVAAEVERDLVQIMNAAR